MALAPVACVPLVVVDICGAQHKTVRTQEKASSSDSRFRRKLSGTTGHRLLGTQRPQMLCVAAWVWFCLSTEFVKLDHIYIYSCMLLVYII